MGYLIAGVFVVLGLLVILCAAAEDRACRAAGGRMISKSTTSFGIGSNGQMVPSFGSVSICITADGRVIE